MQIHTRTVVQEGGGVLIHGTLPTVFEMLQYFKTILTSVESL